MFLRNLFQIARSPDIEGSGGSDDSRPSSSNGYSKEFVSDLRSECKSYRLKVNELEKQAETLKAAAESAKADAAKAADALKLAGEERNKAVEAAKAEAKTAADADVAKARAEAAEASTAASKAFNDRLVRAEVKAGAIAAGIAHQDYVALLDTSAIKVDDKGDVVVPPTFWADAKAAKAHFFTKTGAEAGKTTNPTIPPSPADPGAKRHVSQLSKEEMAVAQDRIKRGLPAFQ